MKLYIYVYYAIYNIHIYIYMVVVQYYCLLKRPFFAKKKLNIRETFANPVFFFRGGCYRQETGVGAEFRWHMFSYMSIHGAVLPLKPRMPIASSCAVLP